MKKTFLFSLLVAALTSCGDEQNIKVGQKTTMELNPVYNAGKVI